MPLTQQIDCPECGERLVRKPGGHCPHCGADVREHVAEERERETRIDQVVAVISTLLVIGLALFVGGCNVVEGVLVYAAAGALVWFLAKRTFW
jgi:DNA-directed RNA polymerase subunit RPC12/RpoP